LFLIRLYLNSNASGTDYVSLGAFGDSFYEYLLKSYLQDVKDSRALKMYIDTMKGVEKKLLQISKESHMMYLASINYGSVEHEMTHLACFAGGLFALGSTVLDSPEREHHLQIGKNLTNTCHESYVRSPTGLGPESFSFASGAEAVASKYREKFYILRPEVVESYFVLYRLTKDPKYREWAWQVVESLNKHCRVDTGFVGIKNVYDLNSEKDDVQQSFVFAELFKYLYLIFCPDEVIDLKKWVFNTEGHPLPVHPRIS
jgi:mannosyl-oligosaccharide alpha-1,2-mannosidase